MASQMEQASQQDSSQMIVEVQLKLIYYVEAVVTFLKTRAATIFSEFFNAFNSYFADSFLHSFLFKCKTCNPYYSGLFN